LTGAGPASVKRRRGQRGHFACEVRAPRLLATLACHLSENGKIVGGLLFSVANV
jgi:hypothetical protein